MAWPFRKRNQEEERAVVAPQSVFLDLPNWSGERVSPSQADRLSAVGRAINLISNDLAKVPLNLTRRNPDGTREPDDTSNLWRLFDSSPNVYQSGFEFRRYVTSQFLTYGNAIVYISRSMRGDVLQLLPLEPNSCSVMVDNETGEFHYQHATMGNLEPDEVLHLKYGLTDSSGIWGYSPIERASEALGLAKAQEKAGASVFKNAANPKMALTHPGNLSDKAAGRLSEQFANAHAGPGSSGKAILLEEGMSVTELKPLELTSAQYIASREFSIQEVSRMYGVPVPYLSEHSRSTYSNVSELVRIYIDSCLSHMACIWSSEVGFKLLSPDQRLEFDLSYVQRGTFVDEINALNTAATSGIMTPNECRQRLGLNPLPGLDDPRAMPGSTTITDEGSRDDDRNPFTDD